MAGRDGMLRLAAGLAALAVVAPAAGAQDQHELHVRAWNTSPGTVAETEIGVLEPDGAPAPARVVVYAPLGYGAAIAQAPGTKLGTAFADADASGMPLVLQGPITAADPSSYASDPAAQACAPGAHAAVWLATMTGGAGVVRFPIFVDAAAGSDTAFASYELRFCPGAADTGGPSAPPLRLEDEFLDMTGVWTNPPLGYYVWRAIDTPYVAGTTTADEASAVEVHSIVSIPQRVTAGARYDRAHRRVVVTGTVAAAGRPRGGIHIHVDASRTANGTYTTLGIATTRKNGSYTFTHALSRTEYLDVYVNYYYLDTCSVAPLGPAPCVRSTISPPPDVYRKVVVRKR